MAHKLPVFGVGPGNVDKRRCHPSGKSTCGLVVKTSTSHAEGRQLDRGQVYDSPVPEKHA